MDGAGWFLLPMAPRAKHLLCLRPESGITFNAAAALTLKDQRSILIISLKGIMPKMPANEETKSSIQMRIAMRIAFDFSSKYASTYFEVLANEPREGFYGWSGHGGSCFQWHPDLNISFAYAQDLG